jgi:membrane-bound lytic murein transglycosylase MltF
MSPFLHLPTALLIILALLFQNSFATNNVSTVSEPVKEADIINRFHQSDLSNFKQMLKRRYIRALVVYSKTGFFFDKGRAKGMQIEYLNYYEKYLNKNIKKESEKIHIIHIPVTFEQLIPALLSGKGDIAASYLTITPERQKKVLFVTAGKLNVNEILVSNKKASKIESVEELSGKSVYLLRNSSYIEHINSLNKKFKAKKLAPIIVEEADKNFVGSDILELINSGIKSYTIIDDYSALLWAKVLPNIKLSQNISISTGNKIGWAVRKENKALQQNLNSFAQTVKKGTQLGNILFKRYYKNTSWIKNINDVKTQKKLKKFVTLFKKYGDKYGFDYLALMAQAYQESGLDQSKKSHRGAVGIMQLLPSTAADKNVSIKNINTVEGNIHAGAKYLAFLRKHYYSNPEISIYSKFAFSWAAYNAGPANVRKMRALTKKMGLDPNKWFNNVEVAAGKLIGRETVHYVAHIYKYYIAYKLSPDFIK